MEKQTSVKTIRERFFNSFPPPEFLNLKVAGVDISDSSVKVLGLKNTQKGYLPDFFEEQKIPDGIVSQGGIVNPEPLIKSLIELRKKYDMKFIRASLPEEKAYLFKTTIPKSKDRGQIFNSVEFQLGEHVPISADESVFDYDIIEKKHDSINVSVTVFPKTVISNYQKVFELSGLTPASFVIEGQAIANAVIPKGDTKTHMIVDFGRARSGISVVKNGIVSYTSTIEVGGNELTEAIMKHFKVDDMEAQKIKNQNEFINNKENEELYNSLMSTISALKDEINRHLAYWENKDVNQKSEDRINKIILCGGNASLSGLSEFLSLGIKVPVEMADVWQNAFSYDDHIPSMSYEESLSYATVVGLTMV